VDVSSISLEAFVNPAGPGRSFANSAEGIAQLACFCQQHGVELVALEATADMKSKHSLCCGRRA
jgi:transposase